MRRRRRSILVLGALALALPCAFAGCVAGCSSDAPPEPNPEPRPEPDPGGTYGAEINVHVVGRGRVKDVIGGLACPTQCFARYVYRDRATAGGTDRATLTAEPAQGARLVGWTFDAAPLGTRGRGPAECSPVKRAGALPQSDAAALTIPLAFGETQGTAPIGREAECASHLTVPLAYNVTATFAELPVADGGDAGDSGVIGEVHLEPPVLGFEGKNIGVYGGTTDSLVYWRLDQGATTQIARATISGATKSVTTVTNSTATSVVLFDVGALIGWQTADGTIGILRASAGSASALVFPSGGTTCRAFASTSSMLYCRTDDSIVGWDPFGGSKQIVHTGLSPIGATIAVTQATSALLFADSNGDGGVAIKSAPGFGDGGVPFMETVVPAVARDPLLLAVNASNVFWLDFDGTNGRGHQAAIITGSTTFDIGSASSPGVRFLRLDPKSETGSFLASPDSILQAKGTALTTFRPKVPSLGGLAVGDSFVYWTQKDGRVLRAPRPPSF